MRKVIILLALVGTAVFAQENVLPEIVHAHKLAPALASALPKEIKSSGVRVPQWIGIGLAVAGIGAGAYGILQNSEYDNLNKIYSSSTDNFGKKWKDMEDAKDRRNLSYIIGSALLASGITIYFVF